MSKVITANILTSGAVVFLGQRRQWVGSVEDASIYADAEAADGDLAFAVADAAKAIVVDPFVTDIGLREDGRPEMTLRDTIRAYGPTIAFLPVDAEGA